MQAFTVHLIVRANLVRYVMSKLVLTGHLAKWALLLNEYEIIYTPANAVKGQVVVDFLVHHPILADWEISDDLPDEQVFFADVSPAWMMFFDRSARIDGAGAGQALIMGLQMAVEMKISSLEVYGDSMLVINQLLTYYEMAFFKCFMIGTVTILEDESDNLDEGTTLLVGAPLLASKVSEVDNSLHIPSWSQGVFCHQGHFKNSKSTRRDLHLTILQLKSSHHAETNSLRAFELLSDQIHNGAVNWSSVLKTASESTFTEYYWE
ncbi:unnamed protein product [Prunus brigantina]